MAQKVQWCENGKGHEGPFYSVFAIAMLAGAGTRTHGQKREMLRKTVCRLCRACLLHAEFRVKGVDFFYSEARDAAQG